jgi:hypothetical protein
METLILEEKNDKAKKIADLAMEKMPIDYFNYYTLVEPFAQGYYELNEKEKAREILTKLIKKYQEELTYFSSLKPSEQYTMRVDIVSNIERYRNIIRIADDAKDVDFYKQEKVKFNNFNKMFANFGRKME